MFQFLIFASFLSLACSVQNKSILKNGIHSVILFLTTGYHSNILSFCFVPSLVTMFLNQNFVASNVERLRDFIKHVYVDRRYSGERNYDKPPRGTMVRCPSLFLFSIECQSIIKLWDVIWQTVKLYVRFLLLEEGVFRYPDIIESATEECCIMIFWIMHCAGWQGRLLWE